MTESGKLPAEIDTGEMARLLGITTRWLSELTKQGDVPKVKRDRYDPVVATKSYVGYVKKANKRDASAKERKEAALAEKAEIEVKKLKGELVPIEDVVSKVEREYGVVRQRLFSMPSNLARDMAAAETPVEAQEKIAEALNEALEVLSSKEQK